MNKAPKYRNNELYRDRVKPEPPTLRTTVGRGVARFLAESNPFRLTTDIGRISPSTDPDRHGQPYLPESYPENLVQALEAIPLRRAAGDAFKAKFDARIAAAHAEADQAEAHQKKAQACKAYIKAVELDSLQVAITDFVEHSQVLGMSPGHAIKQVLAPASADDEQFTPQS